MPDIHITREHSLGLPEARKLAFRWAEAAEEKFDMECTYEEGKSADLVSFTRSGVNGELKVTKDRFQLDARLGFLLGAFKDRIEGEIVKNLDLLLAEKEPAKAFDHALAKRAAAKKAPAAKKTAARKK
ncbi:polyhydroxyalkanoic acid system family protein [Caenimonas soli]|uniref:polyhydroxyalkanoic acid system family protein n=1 Tax=Caenimonas soli TaxID=2735555 RepID=UPI001555016D|nr:polyhydroxyalkanoic acid system family protein [Caenimonas soli]NPC55797.1 polyhydroxyalkanoic acid synthase [Caenimonas soli]